MAAVLPVEKSPWLLVIIFLIFSLTMAWAGAQSYHYHKALLERETIANLRTVANLKAEELGWWRRERLGDAQVVTANPLVARELANLGKSPQSTSARQCLTAWLHTVQEAYHYQSVQLLDAHGKVLLQTGVTSEAKRKFCDNLVKELILHPRVIFGDFHADAVSTGFSSLILAPVFLEGQTNLEGCMVIWIDPQNFLFPLQQTWPKTYPSAEMVLALRQGDEVIVLPQLRRQPGSKVTSLRLSLQQDDVPAVRAIKGWEGPVRGKDYRAVPVLAVVRQVPDSPWYLVAKVDEQEVFAEAERFAFQTFSFAGALIMALGLGLAAVWWQQNTHYLRQLAELEAAQKKKLDDILSATPDWFYLINEDGLFLYANQAANRAASLAPGALVGKTIQEGGFPAATGHHLAAQTAAVFRSGQPCTGEISLPDSAKPRFYDYILTPLHDRQGSITSVLATLRDVTDRKHIEQRLEEELHFKEILLEAIPSPVFFKDTQGRYLGCNRAFETLIGQSRKDFVGKSVFELAPAELAAIYHVKDMELLEARRVQVYESQVRLADGHTLEVIFYKAPFTHLDGRLAGLIGVIVDITDRRRVEEDLRQAKEFLSSILAHAPMPLFVNHRDGRFLLVNSSWETLAGKSQETVLEESLDELFSPQTVELFNKTNRQVIETGNPVDIEENLRVRGQSYYFQTVKFPLRNAQGEIEAVGGISLDITKRKLAEKELIAKEQFIRNSLDSLPQHLAILDAFGNIIFINAAWKRFALENGANGDFLGANYLTVCDGAKGKSAAEAPLVAAGIRACLEGTINQYSIEYPCPSPREERYFVLRANRFLGEGQIQVAVTHIDITERKLAENQVKASLREKEVLLKEIHHRVKNNMQIVSSLLRLQSGRVKNREIQEVFQESQNRIRSMALVHEMLYRSPDLSRVHFSSYLEVLTNSLYRSLRASPKQIALQLDLEEISLPADQALSCGLIITELISNALKYAFPKGRQGKLRLCARQASKGVMELVVHDNGVGLPPELNHRTTDSLGLRLVILLAGQLHGTVNVDRTNGTSFIITFGVPDHE